MPLLEDLKNKISSYATEKYDVEDTNIVPSTDYSKLTFGNKGLKCHFAFLFVEENSDCPHLGICQLLLFFNICYVLKTD